MHARGSNGWSLLAGVGLLLALGTPAAADPKPQPVDIEPFRGQLVVLTDADGGIYVALPGSKSRLWYGTRGKTKNLYEQVVTGRSTNEHRWDVTVYAPRVPNIQPGSVGLDDSGYYRYCGAARKTPLTLVTGDKAAAILDSYTFMTSAMIRAPYLLARDSFGVYYYVDHIRAQYGGKGYRVFIGKKGAMKERPLVDIATDSAGDVFGTKTGDIHLVRVTSDEPASSAPKVTLVRGGKETKLTYLDTVFNSVLIFKDLGIYGFTGSICESL